jgi:hypothetical protein
MFLTKCYSLKFLPILIVLKNFKKWLYFRDTHNYDIILPLNQKKNFNSETGIQNVLECFSL